MGAWTKLGAFWTKVSRSEKKFLAGDFDCPHCKAKTKITCWPNTKGDNPKRPDFIIYLSEDMAAPAPTRSDADETAPTDDDHLPF